MEERKKGKKEERKKKIEEWIRRGETTGMKRMIVTTEETREMIKKIVQDNLSHLEDIILSGDNRIQQDFYRSDASRIALHQSDLSTFVTREQETIILEQLNKKWRNKPSEYAV